MDPMHTHTHTIDQVCRLRLGAPMGPPIISVKKSLGTIIALGAIPCPWLHQVESRGVNPQPSGRCISRIPYWNHQQILKISPPCASWGSETSPALCWKVALCLSKHGWILKERTRATSLGQGVHGKISASWAIVGNARGEHGRTVVKKAFWYQDLVQGSIAGNWKPKKVTTNSFSSDNQGLQVSNKEIL